MKLRLTTLCLLAFCSACSSQQDETLVVALSPTNTQEIIMLQSTKTGDLVCCKDTAYTTAEECAIALEKDCFVRVQDIPYRTAKYDYLTTDTYPTRRWRENETSPRW